MTNPLEDREGNPTRSSSKNDSDVDYRKISSVLRGKADPLILTEKEEEIWADRFAELMSRPSDEELEYYAELRLRHSDESLEGNSQAAGDEPSKDEFEGQWPDDNETWPA